MAKFDLTHKIGQYLDRHLVLPHLEFLSAKEIFDENELLQVKLDILSKTHMVDYEIDVKCQVYPDINAPQEMKLRRQDILNELGRLHENAKVILDLMSNDEKMKKIAGMRDNKSLIKFLYDEVPGFQMEMMDDLVKLAKYRYECGNYQVSSSYLYFYMLVMSPTDKNYLNASWGKLASEILTQDWDTALEDINKLRDYIDNNIGQFNSLQVLQQRTWLIHWSLFVFFNHIKGRDMIIDMFLYRPHYLNAIQTMCPHILRYLATAVIVNRSKRSALKDLVKVIQQESYSYRDPITELLEHLYVNFDFDGARQKLQECQTVLCNDFFLIALLTEFVESARLMIFETFCRIHQCISIQMLSEKLNMEVEVAECWIVNLIRSAGLNAKIDSKLGHVVMGGQPASPYQQLIEKIETLSVRSEALEALIERKVKAKNQDHIVWNT